MKASLIAREAKGSLSREQSRLLRLQAERSPALHAEIEAARLRSYSFPSQTTAGSFLRTRAPQLIAAAALVLAIAGALFFAAHRQTGKPAVAAQTSRPPSKPLSTPAAAAPPFAFFLSAIHLRGPQTIPVLNLPHAAATIELQIEIRGDAPQSVTLRRNASVVAAQSRPPVRSEGSIRYLSLRIDRARLAPGDYLLDIVPAGNASGHDLRPFTVRDSA